MKDLKDSGLVTQLVVVATMMPKVKQYIDDLIAENEALKNAKQFIQNFAEEQHQRAVALEMRELTDEEIEQVFEEVYKYKANNLNMDFARAILRKAQE